MTRIVLDRVSKTYPPKRSGDQPKPTIPGLDLVIEDGEFLVLVGPSGCGKSTALRLVAGLEDVTEGTIHFDDRDVTRLEARDRNIAFVFQNYALYPHMTVAGNIGFPLRMARTPRETIAAKVESAARLLKLTGELGSLPRQLSGGQSQRVAMGRAIVREPDVFLMDEPLSNLDAMLRVEMRTEISSLQRELGKTTVYVTHDGEEAMTMGHRVAVLRDGLLQQCATPGALYASPVNAFVAGFVGNPQMNFVPGKLWRDDGWKVAFGPIRIPLPDSAIQRHPRLLQQEGSAVILGFRPESVRIDPHASDAEALDVQVTSVQHLGRETRALFPAPTHGEGVGEIDQAQLDRITNKVGRSGELMVSTTPPRPMRVGERLRLTVDPAALYLFDALGTAL